MAGTVSPYPRLQLFDNNGDPANAYQLFVYDAGTTNKATTYSDVNLTVSNANPIVLDSAGRAMIFLGASSFKFVLAPPTDSDPPNSPTWTADNVSSTPPSTVDLDITAVAGENLAASDAVYLSDGSGGATAGRWYKTDADNTYSSTGAGALGFAPSAILSGATGTVRVNGRITGLSSLTPGATYYISQTNGAITIAPPANARSIGVADTTTSLVLSSSVSLPAATASVAGIVSIIAQSFAGLKTFTEGLQSDIPLTFKAPGGSSYISAAGRLTSVIVTVGNVGAGEDNLMLYTLPAGTLSTDGMAVKVIAWGHTANNANSKNLKAYFGATQLLGGAGALLTVSETGSWMAGFVVVRTAAATQRAAAQVVSGPAGSTITASVAGVTTPAETLSGTVDIKFTGEATTNDDITQEGMIVTLLV